MSWPALELFRLAANECGTSTGVLPSLYKGLCRTGSNEIQIKSVHDVVVVIANVTQILIAVSGGLAVIFLLIASIYYITSTGDPGRTKKARDMIQSTIIGLIIIVMAYAVIGLIAAGL